MAVWKGRKYTGKHTGLYGLCNIQFRADTFPFRSDRGQVTNIGIDIQLHFFHGIIQILDFISSMNFSLCNDGFLLIFFSLGYKRSCCFCQTVNWHDHHAVHGVNDQSEQNHRSKQHQNSERTKEGITIHFHVIHGNVNTQSTDDGTIVCIDSGTNRTEPAILRIIGNVGWKTIVTFLDLRISNRLNRICGSDWAFLSLTGTIDQIDAISGVNIRITDVNRTGLVLSSVFQKVRMQFLIFRQGFHFTETAVISIPV